ncbi:hypothetical protein WKI68_42590 [Streptomyces sp. MS1.HAVA.3]|uniref:Uncharacterized protein n=1 Tax=Streptomyces caledonius TaxID=3134107 RepID=A0ABU8UE05_9ACTN
MLGDARRHHAIAAGARVSGSVSCCASAIRSPSAGSRGRRTPGLELSAGRPRTGARRRQSSARICGVGPVGFR